MPSRKRDPDHWIAADSNGIDRSQLDLPYAYMLLPKAPICRVGYGHIRRDRSWHLIAGLGPLSTLALHDFVEGSIIRALASFEEERGSVHGCQLLGDGGCDELVEAGAVRLGAPDHFGFHGCRQAERIGALGLAHDGVG